MYVGKFAGFATDKFVFLPEPVLSNEAANKLDAQETSKTLRFHMFLQMMQEEVSPLHTLVEQKRKNPSSLNILKTCYLAFEISILSALVVNHASCKYMQYISYHILSTKSTCKS